MKSEEQIKTDLIAIFENSSPDIEISNWESRRAGKKVNGLKIVISEMYNKPTLKSLVVVQF